MKIVATIAYSSLSDNSIKKIILADADALRFNLSNGTLEENLQHIRKAEKIIEELHAETKIFLDLPSPKIRLGDFEQKFFSVLENEEFTFQTGDTTPDCETFFPVRVPKLGERVRLHQTISLGDGEMALQVTEIVNNATIKMRALNNGIIQAMKSFNISENYFTDEEMIGQYQQIITTFKSENVHCLLMPYTASPVDHRLEEMIRLAFPQAILGYKIENRVGLDNIDDICRNKDIQFVVLERGNLGVNIPYEQIGAAQENFIKTTKKYGKYAMISTQILESTINNYIPSRADISDLYNIAKNQIYGIILCKETGVGKRPAYAISVAKKIIQAAK